MVLLIANSRGGDSVLPISDCDVGKVSVHEWIELWGFSGSVGATTLVVFDLCEGSAS